MSKPLRRLQRQAINAQRSNKEQQETALPNSRSAYATVAQEQAARFDAVSAQMGILRSQLPHLLKRLAQIAGRREPHMTRHKLTVLLLYGLLMFVFQFASCRAVNREMTRPQFEANLRRLFPELDALPHADTSYRLVRDIDVSRIEQAHIELVQRLIRGKKFRRYLINNHYSLAIDGSQKLAHLAVG